MDVKHARFFLNLPYPENLIKTICLDKELIINDEMLQALPKVLETCLPREQQILELRFKERLTFAQISASIGLPLVSVRRIYRNTFRRLRHPSRYNMIMSCKNND